MAKAGDELVNQVTGLRTVFRKTARDTGGELLRVDWIGSPGWTTGPDHVHPRQEDLPSPTPTGRTHAETTARWVFRFESTRVVHEMNGLTDGRRRES
jgi:hypothetical protein